MAEGRDKVLRDLQGSRPAGLSVAQPDPELVRQLRAVVRPNPLRQPKPCVLGPTCYLFEFTTLQPEDPANQPTKPEEDPATTQPDPVVYHHCNVWLSGVQAPDDPSLNPFFCLPSDDTSEDNIYHLLTKRELRLDLHYVNENYWIVGDVYVRGPEESEEYFSLCHHLVSRGLARVVGRHPNLEELAAAEEAAEREGRGYWRDVKAVPVARLKGKVTSVFSGFTFRVEVDSVVNQSEAPAWVTERLDHHRRAIRLHLSEVLAPQLNQKFYHEARNEAMEFLFNKTVEVHIIAYYAGVELIKEPVVVLDDYAHFKGTVFYEDPESGQPRSFQELLVQKFGTAQVTTAEGERAYRVPWCRFVPPHNYAIRRSPDYREVLLARFRLLGTPNIYEAKTLPFETRDLSTYQHRPTNASLKWIASKQQAHELCVRKTAKKEAIFATFQSVKLYFGDTPGLLRCSVLLHLPEDELAPPAPAPAPAPASVPIPAPPAASPFDSASQNGPTVVTEEQSTGAAADAGAERVEVSTFNEDDEVELEPDEESPTEHSAAVEKEPNCIYRCPVQIFTPLTHPARLTLPKCKAGECPLHALHSCVGTLSDAQVRAALAHLVEKEVLVEIEGDNPDHRLRPVDGRLSFFGRLKNQNDVDLLDVLQGQLDAFAQLEHQDRDPFVPRWPHGGSTKVEHVRGVDRFCANQRNPALRSLYACLHWIAPFFPCSGRCVRGVRVNRKPVPPQDQTLCCGLRLLAQVSRELCLAVHSTTRLGSARPLNRRIFEAARLERGAPPRVFDVRFFTGFPRIVRDKNLQTQFNDLNVNNFADLLTVSRLDRVDYDRFPKGAVRFMGRPWEADDTHRLLAEFAPAVPRRSGEPPLLVKFASSRLYCTLLAQFLHMMKRPAQHSVWVDVSSGFGTVVQTVVLRRLGDTAAGVLYECGKRLHFPQEWNEEAEARKDGRAFCVGPEKVLTPAWKTHIGCVLQHHLTDLGPFSLAHTQMGPSSSYDPCADDDHPLADNAGWCTSLEFHSSPLGLACVLREEDRVLLPQFDDGEAVTGSSAACITGRSALFRRYAYGGRAVKRADQLYKGQPGGTDYTTYERPLQRNAERGNYLLWWCATMLHRAYGTLLAFCTHPPSVAALLCLERTQLLRDGCVVLGLEKYLADNYARTATGTEAENWRLCQALREAEENHQEADRTFTAAPADSAERKAAKRALDEARAALDQAKRGGYRARQSLFQGSADTPGVSDRLFAELVTLLDRVLQEAVRFMEDRGDLEAVVRFRVERFEEDLEVKLWSMADPGRRQNMEHDDEGVALFRLSNCAPDWVRKVEVPQKTRSFADATLRDMLAR